MKIYVFGHHKRKSGPHPEWLRASKVDSSHQCPVLVVPLLNVAIHRPRPCLRKPLTPPLLGYPVLPTLLLQHSGLVALS